MGVQIRGMSEGNLISLWTLYVGRLQELLQAGAASQQSAEQQQIMQRVNMLQREATLIAIRSVVLQFAALAYLQSHK